jgi:IS30 family transposase
MRPDSGLREHRGRPAVVERRGRYGDWEGDTVIGTRRQGGAVTLVDRKSGYLLLGRVGDLQAATVRHAMTESYCTTPPALRKPLAHGKESAEHQQLAVEASLRIHFAKPSCAWQRGNSENTNGLIRQFFPKGTDSATGVRDGLRHLPDAQRAAETQ